MIQPAHILRNLNERILFAANVVPMKSVKRTKPYIAFVVFYKITNLFATDTFRSSRQIRNFRQLLFVVHPI